MTLATIEFGLILLASAGIVWAVARMVRVWQRVHGDRIVTCTATGYPAAVRINAVKAAVAAVISSTPKVEIGACSRWTAGGLCDQGCVAEASAPESATRTIVARWYDKKKCVYCANPITVHSFGHRAALRSPQGTTREWSDVPANRLLEVLGTDAPVCWNCHVAETLRSRYPHLVTDRPWPKNTIRRVG
jgi:hypothetical protein